MNVPWWNLSIIENLKFSDFLVVGFAENRQFFMRQYAQTKSTYAHNNVGAGRPPLVLRVPGNKSSCAREVSSDQILKKREIRENRGFGQNGQDGQKSDFPLPSELAPWVWRSWYVGAWYTQPIPFERQRRLESSTLHGYSRRSGKSRFWLIFLLKSPQAKYGHIEISGLPIYFES